MKRVSVLIFVILLMIVPQLESKAAEETFDIHAYTADMQPGWNLGNTYDAVGEDETAWGNPRVTRELIQFVKAEGYNSIRVPLTFDGRMDENYTIDEDFLARIKQTVDWSLEEDLKVMINIHHDSWIWLEGLMPEDEEEAVKGFTTIWEQLIQVFGDYPIELMFESINEPRFAAGDEEAQGYLDRLNDVFYQLVRESGGINEMRPLIIPTMHTAMDAHYVEPIVSWIDEQDDDYLIATVHFYGFWPFSVNIMGETTFGQNSLDHFEETLNYVDQAFQEIDTPVVVGEFGLLGFDTHVDTIQQGEKLKFFEYAINYMQDRDMVHMLWDNGQHINRQSYTWYDQELAQMMKYSFEGRQAYAETDYLYFKKGETVLDRSLHLTLNDRQLESIALDGYTLASGDDYTLSGDTLQINASFLTEVLEDNVGKYGHLELQFDNGYVWKVELRVFDVPILSDYSSNVPDFYIPTVFNGDQLITMEAVYADDPSQSAGPQNWTSFKEFGYVFNPNPNEDKISFVYDEWNGYSRFFSETDVNREVLITLHFLSGTTLTYNVIHDGEVVTGVIGTDTDPDPTPEPDPDPDPDLEPTPDPEPTPEPIKPYEIKNGELIILNDWFKTDEAKVGNLVITDESVNAVTFTKAQLEEMKTRSDYLLIAWQGVQLRIPLSELSGDVRIEIGELTDRTLVHGDEAASKIYEIAIYNDGEKVTHFDTPVKLTLPLKGQVSVDETLAIFYYDESNDAWKQIGGVVDDNSIEAEVTHFSIFAAFDTTVFEDEDEAVLVDDAPEETSATGETLPDTATSIFNGILVGFMLVAGGGLLIIKTRKRKFSA